MNNCLMILQPRFIPECIESLSKLKIEKRWFVAMDEFTFCREINKFVATTNFDNYLLNSDDFIVTDEALEKVVKLLEKKEAATGWCQMAADFPYANLSTKPLIKFKKSGRVDLDSYTFPTMEEIKKGSKTGITYFAGYCFTGMRRKLWLEHPLRINEYSKGQSDFELCLDLQKSHVPIYYHRDGFMIHLKKRVLWSDMKQSLIGKIEPHVSTIPYKPQDYSSVPQMRVEVGVGTSGRWDSLAVTLTSLLGQTFKNWDLTIIDDSSDHPDLRTNTVFLNLFKIMEELGHRWRIFYGPSKGFHFAYQIIVNQSIHPLTFIIADDMIFDSKCLKNLYDVIDRDKKIGCVSGLCLTPNGTTETRLPSNWRENPVYDDRIRIANDEIEFSNSPQYAYHTTPEPKEVESLVGCLLYRTNVGKQWGFNLDLSYVARTAGIDFTYQFVINGYKCLVIPSALHWHFSAPSYGKFKERNDEFSRLGSEDNKKFLERVKRWKNG